MTSTLFNLNSIGGFGILEGLGPGMIFDSQRVLVRNSEFVKSPDAYDLSNLWLLIVNVLDYLLLRILRPNKQQTNAVEH